MKVGLFIPCYVDQFFPHVGISVIQLLEKLNCEVVYPLGQTCCGQPLSNSGFHGMTAGCTKNFIDNFRDFEYIVCPSGSCALHIKEHLTSEDPAAPRIRNAVYELSEFLIDVLKVKSLESSFPYKVGIHVSCHGQRGLHLSSMSELVKSPFSKPEALLQMVRNIELVYPKRTDECCGFGGTFCIFEEAVSVKMGVDRIAEHETKEVDYITSVDMSCLMHLEGILKRKKSRIQVKHIAEILNGQ